MNTLTDDRRVQSSKRVLSPELQECMDTNERSAATGAHGKEPRTPKR